jgi:hypothetical protein
VERKNLKNINLLDLVPIHAVEWGKNIDGTVFLRKPKVKSRFLKTVLKKLGLRTHYKIHLDEFGSHVWKACDGTCSVYQIGENLKATYGEKIEPVYERLGQFIKTLASQQCLVYKDEGNSTLR